MWDRLKLWAVLPPLVLCGCAASESGESRETGSPLFEDVSAETGLAFWQYSGATGDLYLPEIMGSGAALFDYDNDGDQDVYLVQGSPPPKAGTEPVVPLPAGWKPGNRLFRNDWIPGGKLAFTDVTAEAGVGLSAQGMGVAAGDYDNDGNADLYVTNYESDAGSNVLFHNNGDGTFTDVTQAAGVASSGWSTSTAFLDYDRDGMLDLAVVHYVDYYPRACRTAAAEVEYCGPQVFPPTVTQLFRNRGDGRFEDVTAEVGLNADPGPGLGILTGDFNSDGWPDFLVANDAAANHLWLNETSSDGSGRRVFRETGLTQGLAYAADGQPRAGMGVAMADLYGNGAKAVVVTNLLGEGFTLFSSQPNGEYVDATMGTGMFRSSRPYTGFGVGFLDMENRGLVDLFAANGEVKVVPELIGKPFPYGQRNMLVRNLGPGNGFEDVTGSAGPAFALAEVSRAAAFGDVNNDGGVDILVTNNNGPARLLLNTVPNRGHWILVNVEGVATNRSGYGSTVKLIRSDGSYIERLVRGGGSYLAANDARVHFGLGDASEIRRIEIGWVGGACESWDEVEVDQIVTLREGSGKPCSASSTESGL